MTDNAVLIEVHEVVFGVLEPADDGVTILASDLGGVGSAGGGTGDLLAANNLSDLDDVATARTNLGLGTAATQASSAFDASGTAAAAVAALSTVYQPLDSDLTAIAALSTSAYGRAFLTLANNAALRTVMGPSGTPSSSTFLRGDGTWASPAGGGGGDMLASNNLAELTSPSTARTNLGLGTAATTASTAYDAAGAAAAAQAASQPLDSDLTAIAALTTTSFGRGFLALANAAAARSTIGISAANTPITDSGGYFTGTDTEAALQELGETFHDLTAISVPPLQDLLVNFDNMNRFPVHDLSSALTMAANNDSIVINRGVWSGMRDDMRAANPDLEILVYMNIGEAQNNQGPTDGSGGSAYWDETAYTVDVTGAYITNTSTGSGGANDGGGNYLMDPTTAAWQARCTSDADTFLADGEGDGLLVDVAGPGPVKWNSPSDPGSYSGRPVYRVSGTISPASTLTQAESGGNTLHTSTTGYPSSYPYWVAVEGTAGQHRVYTVTGKTSSTFTVTETVASHPNGARVARAWDDSEWLVATAALAATVKTHTGVKVIANGLQDGPHYEGAFTSSGQAATSSIIASIDGGQVESFVRGKTDAPTAFRAYNRWIDELNMLTHAGANSKELYLTTKTWTTPDATLSERQRNNLYAFATALLGYTPGYMRFFYSEDHGTDYNGATYQNPLKDIYLGAPTASYVDVASGSGCFTRRFANGFVAVNPQTTSKNVTLPTAMYPWNDTSTVSGSQTLAANTAMIWLDSLDSTSALLKRQDADALYDPKGAADTAIAVSEPRLTTVTRAPADPNYTADPGDYVLMDVSTSARDVHLPAEAVDGDRVRVRLNVQASSRKVTVKPDVGTLDVADGSGWFVLTDLGEEHEWTYDATNLVWRRNQIGVVNRPRARTMSDTGTVTPDATYDVMYMTSVTGALTVNAIAGTARKGQLFTFHFHETNSTVSTITWNANYHGSPPTSTTASGELWVSFRYNTVTSAWDYQASGTSGGGTAATTTFTPAGNIAATDVQAALEELDTEKQAAGTYYSAGGTDVPVTDGGTGASTASGARTNLGLGTIATQDSSNVTVTGGSVTGITDLAVADGGTGASTAAGARTNLGLVIGTDVQAYDADLATYAGITPSSWAQARLVDANQAANLSALGLSATGTLSRLVSGMVVPPNSLDKWKTGRSLPATSIPAALLSGDTYTAVQDSNFLGYPDTFVKLPFTIDSEEVFATAVTAPRSVTDGVLNSTTTVTSATASFVAGDVRRPIFGSGIPRGTYIAAVGSSTSITLSAAATATASGVTLTIGASHTFDRGINGTTAAAHSAGAEAVTTKVRRVIHLGDSIVEGATTSTSVSADGWSIRAARAMAKRLGGEVGQMWPMWRNTSTAQVHQEYALTGSSPSGNQNYDAGWAGSITFTGGSSNGFVWTRPAGLRVQTFDIHWVDYGANGPSWSYSLDGGSTWIDNPVTPTIYTSGTAPLRRTRIACDDPTTIRLRAANAAGTSKTIVLPYAPLTTWTTPPVTGVTEGVLWANLGIAGYKLRTALNSRTFTDGIITSTTTLTSATAAFVTADVGSTIYVNGVANTISARTSGTVVTLGTPVSNSSGARITIFQNDSSGDRMANFLGHHGSTFPDLVIIGPFTNDIGLATTANGDTNPDAMTDMLTYLVGKILPVADVLLVACYEIGAYDATLQGQYRTAIEAVAASTGCASLNFYDAFAAYGYTGYSAVNSAGFMADTTHLSPKGNRWMGSHLTRVLEII